MKKNYFKLDLKDCYFYQKDESNQYVFSKYKIINDIKYLFFEKVSNNTYEEKLTRNRLVIKDNLAIYPLGISVNASSLSKSSSEEIIYTFNNLKNNNLLLEYNRIIDDLLVNSNLLCIMSGRSEEINDIIKK